MDTFLTPLLSRTSPGPALSSVRWSLSKRSPSPFRHIPKNHYQHPPFCQTLAPAQLPKKKKLYQLLPAKSIPPGALFPRSLRILVKAGERRRNTRGSSCPEACAGHKETHQKSEKNRKKKKYTPPYTPKTGHTGRAGAGRGEKGREQGTGTGMGRGWE